MRQSITVGPKKLPVMFYYIRSKLKTCAARKQNSM